MGASLIASHCHWLEGESRDPRGQELTASRGRAPGYQRSRTNCRLSWTGGAGTDRPLEDGQRVSRRDGLWHLGGPTPSLRAGRSVQRPGLQDTYGVEELSGETQVVMERQKGDPLQPDHDDLREMGALLLTSPVT